MQFCGSTYQVEVIDAKDSFWVFLTLGKGLDLVDCFCSCQESEELGVCAHIAKGYLALFDKELNPLHLSFERSFWNHYFKMCHERTFEKEYAIEVKEEAFAFHSSFFSFVCKDQGIFNQLNALFFDREEETEESSIKFSNLPFEELNGWRQGAPSLDLRYRLSFWYDLAQLLFLSGIPETTYRQDLLPTTLIFNFSTFSGTAELFSLAPLIPYLPTIAFPLPVIDTQNQEIASITFNQTLSQLVVEHCIPTPQQGGIQVGEWTYYPDQKFVRSTDDRFFQRTIIPEEEIANALESYSSIISMKLENTHYTRIPKNVHRFPIFDAEWNLTIEPYIEKVGDLRNTMRFGRWVFSEKEGFFPLIGSYETEVISKSLLEEGWIDQNRYWLKHNAGFAFHLTEIEETIGYRVSEMGELAFYEPKKVTKNETLSSCDFGNWVYFKGEGFYPKNKRDISSSISPGTTVNPAQLPFFIKMYRNELKKIPHFFAKESPIEACGLSLTFLKEENIYIAPRYTLKEGYQENSVHFYEKWTYAKGEGFAEIPREFSLPERYQYPLRFVAGNFDAFILYELEEIEPYLTELDPRLIPPYPLNLVIEHLEQADRGYCAKMYYQSPDGRLPFIKIWEAFNQEPRFHPTEIGLIDTKLDRFHWMVGIDRAKVNEQDNLIILSILDLIKLSAYEQVIVSSGADLWEKITSFKVDDVPVSDQLSSPLRPYQVLGLQWLWFLYRYGLSGLLCDEMGLGKTHQAMALLAAVSQELPKSKFLVICPTSVIYHWEDKLKEFLPGCRVLIYHGLSRELDQEYDLLLTTYGIWRNDVEFLKMMPFEVAVFDEIQVAKNERSRLHHALKLVSGTIKLGLTGTPIENRIRELKSLFDLVLPGYMPREREYREFFIRPIERDQDKSRQLLLNRFISPFVLRRKKNDVLADLPDKTIEIAHCELSEDQKMLYNSVVSQTKGTLIAELNDISSPIPYMHIFAALSNLKQICNHPAAYLKTPQDYQEYASGKWDLFVELLSEARESGQKVVVFSQFLAMLDIMELYLNKEQIEFATIRGETMDRGKQLARFATDPTCEVFLGSLQAAGLGIDLTAASVVIHYDRWWNDARESQATDRVHRIGQSKGVQVFKCVTKNSLEERIDQMIERKRRLMEETIGVDDHRILKTFSRDELIELLTEI